MPLSWYPAEDPEHVERDHPDGALGMVRWVNATKNPDTRRRRGDVSISKMQSGKKRHCCFNLSACTDKDLSKNGRLLEPANDRP